ncbi:TPA: DNA methylase [Burkholderia vietnamiensis]|uniref:Methyltransferase n=1 Tax=Burkholderia vietnamiensis TaxID=60552 RepID=A0AA44XXG0_BURVI|nr:DNA methyltransferase [Burkholderia vietnamiensis]MCA8210137.1 DNA methylase [Burkholderia vietnamiensis]PRH40411.1 DNA methylase [Burkholderia vietnamiensis]HDR9019313.1 DNA methylase [Burkholderia vietnamiensis]HDR9103099.1 DNA methylase [Burkholderia vietnamiensis]HDR9122763.1 DNA methylase [Burkholderia vietnamiensis]
MSFLYNGDCLEVLPSIPDGVVDFVLTDPPYLVNYQDRTGRSIANDVKSDWLAPAFAEVYRVMKPNTLCVSFYGWTKTDLFFDAWKRAGLRVVGHIVFAKSYASKSRFVAYRHESAYVLAKGQPAVPATPLPDVMRWEYSGNRHHPTQKPVPCLRRLIETYTAPGDVVLDPFAGSGSTCVAARELGRYYIGIELDPTYYAAACDRLEIDRLAIAA